MKRQHGDRQTTTRSGGVALALVWWLFHLRQGNRRRRKQVVVDSDHAEATESSRSTATTAASVTVSHSNQPTAHIKELQQQHSTQKRVSFSSVSIRSYEVILGDHPCCKDGCALTLGWEYTDEEPPEEGACSSGDSSSDNNHGETGIREPQQQPSQSQSTTVTATSLDEYERLRAQRNINNKISGSNGNSSNSGFSFKPSREERSNRLLAVCSPHEIRANHRRRDRRIRRTEHRIFFHE